MLIASIEYIGFIGFGKREGQRLKWYLICGHAIRSYSTKYGFIHGLLELYLLLRWGTENADILRACSGTQLLGLVLYCFEQSRVKASMRMRICKITEHTLQSGSASTQRLF